MRLEALVSYFRKGGSFSNFCESNSLNPDSEVIEVYMEKPFSLTKDLAFFEIEETEGSVEYSHREVLYSNLFDFYFFLDAMEEAKNGEAKLLSDKELAKKLLDYAIHDA